MKNIVNYIQQVSTSRSNLITFVAFFSVFLVWFVWNASCHLPSQLIINGSVQSPTEARVSWDSGSGFNDMESADVVFGRPVDATFVNPVIKIRRTGGSHPSARSSEVRIKLLKLSQDDHANTLQAFAQQKGTEITAEGYLLLREDGAMIELPAGRDFTAICFVANEHSGFVEIELNGDKRIYDLYADQPQVKWIERKNQTYAGGDFITIVNLPRYDIRRLQIASVETLQTFRIASATISSAKGEINLPIIGNGLASSLNFSDIPRNTRQHFHPILFLQQVLFALLSAWLACSVLRFIRLKGGISSIMTEGKRPVFWMMFIGAILSFSAWLLVYWPGHFTTDSVHIWWAAKQPAYFMHDHPVMNVIYYRFLQQFWDHFAIVGISQILLTSLLGSYIFYWLYKKGVSFYIILTFYLLFITSIPIGLYNVTLWKDIPFALLIVFWAFWFVKLVSEKKNGGTKHSRSEIIIMCLLLIALGLFRYNGIVYFLLIPTGIAFLGLIPKKKFLLGFAGILILSAILVSITVMLDRNNFVMSQSRFFINRMSGFGAGETALRVIKQYPTLLDINIIKKKNIWYDTWYRDSGVTNWHYGFAREKGYNEWIRYIPSEPKSEQLYKLLNMMNLFSSAEPWVYFTWNPFYLLLIFPVCFLYRLFPLTAAYSYVVLSQTLILLWVLGPYNYNWRYYYFLYVSLFFLIPIIVLDSRSMKNRFQPNKSEIR